jgi:hypothetical protein
MGRDVKNPRGHADRRDLLKGLSVATGLRLSPAFGSDDFGRDATSDAAWRMMGVLGAASAGPDRLKIAMLVHPKNGSAGPGRALDHF